jgi:hypothetical protein
VLGLLRTVPTGFSSSPLSSERRDRRSCTEDASPGTLTPTSLSLGPGPTWDRGPHVQAALPSLELILVVEQHEVGPGDGAVLGKHVGRSARGMGLLMLIPFHSVREKTQNPPWKFPNF